MAQLRLSLLLLLSLSSIAASAHPPVARRSRSRAFIEASCQRTLYPSLCIRSLSGFANKTKESPQLLAQIALSVTLVKAQQTRKFILNTFSDMKGLMSEEHQGLKDCLGQINDSVDRLSQSTRELQRLARVQAGPAPNSDPMWHISNVETWVSTALTDANACIEGFSGRVVRGKLKATVKGKVLNMAQHTSNALALFTRFASRYRATTGAKDPKV